ncbi:MAG: ABC transporter ATP-binding protein [Bacteroidales bacterium]
MASRLLEMKSVSASYGKGLVLEDVEFSVYENDFVGVIGPNGGGKTTLLRLILGLVKPAGGSIVFSNVLGNNNKIGYLPQMSTGDISYPLTVRDVILSGLMIRKGLISGMTSADKKKADEIIESLGLNEFRNSSPGEISGGQLQRVLLGRAVIGDPKLLLLDEPGNFVDSNFENDFYEKLKVLNHRMAILMVSHDIGTITAHIKTFACVNGHLHYHPSPEITNEQLLAYNCPIQLITHGDVPHTVLKTH